MADAFGMARNIEAFKEATAAVTGGTIYTTSSVKNKFHILNIFMSAGAAATVTVFDGATTGATITKQILTANGNLEANVPFTSPEGYTSSTAGANIVWSTSGSTVDINVSGFESLFAGAAQ